MTQQITDPFIWEDEEWIFLRAEDIYSLFDPEAFGLMPEMSSTACYKGFVVQFRVTEKQLYLDKLWVYCENDSYPPINGIEPKDDDDIDYGMKLYDNINLKLSYSGVMIVGREMMDRFQGRAFTGPHSYRITHELTFKDGMLVDSKETSGSYVGF
ncbi:MAG: hypothetical protein J6332_08735 [Abditibacteriota bacterium]|nr:hypothetical protein [Abditibacteriota bacterium]